MSRIKGVLQVSGIGRDYWVEIKDTEGRCFVLGEPGETVDLVVVRSIRRVVCPKCQGARVIFFTPATSLVPTYVNRCSRCDGRGFIPLTELTSHEVPNAVVHGTIKRS